MSRIGRYRTFVGSLFSLFFYVATVAIYTLPFLRPVATVAQGRAEVTVVVHAGIERTEVSSAIPFYANSPGCGVFTKSAGSGVRGEVGILLQDIFLPRLGLYGGLGWVSRSIESTSDSVPPLWTFDAETKSEVMLDRLFKRTDRWQQIGPEFMLQYAFLKTTSVGLGLSSNFIFGLLSEQREELTTDEEFYFSNGEQSRLMNVAHPLTPSLFLIDLRASLHQSIRLNDRVGLSVGLNFLYTLLSPFPNEIVEGWSLRGEGGVYLDFSPKSNSEEELPLPTIPVLVEEKREQLLDTTSVQISLPPQRNRLSGEIDLYTLDAAGEKKKDAILVVGHVRRIEVNSQRLEVSRHVDQFVTPPIVQVDPAYQADAGLLWWEVMLKYGDSVIVRSSSDQTEVGQGENWQKINITDNGVQEFLVAELNLEDSTGKKKNIQAEIPLIVRRVDRLTFCKKDTVRGTEEWVITLPLSKRGDEANDLSFLATELNWQGSKLTSAQLFPSSIRPIDSASVQHLQSLLDAHEVKLSIESAPFVFYQQEDFKDILTEEEQMIVKREPTLLLHVKTPD